MTEDFLSDNKVKSGWKRYILDGDLKTKLDAILQTVGLEKEKKNSTFKALSYFEPEDTKVIIIGQDPLPIRDGIDKSTGLAFSMDCWDDDIEPIPPSGIFPCIRKTGHSVWRVHDSLKKAGILEAGKIYHCKHIEWARKNVLLLNVALTCGQSPGDHVDLWLPFTEQLLGRFVRDAVQETVNTGFEKRIYVLLWGCRAQNVWQNATSEFCDEDLGLFRVMPTAHPAAEMDNDIFLEKTMSHFKEIDHYYGGIFYINERSFNDDDDLNEQNVSTVHDVDENMNGETLKVVPGGYVTPVKSRPSVDNILKVKNTKIKYKSNITEPYARRLHFTDECVPTNDYQTVYCPQGGKTLLDSVEKPILNRTDAGPSNNV